MKHEIVKKAFDVFDVSERRDHNFPHIIYAKDRNAARREFCGSEDAKYINVSATRMPDFDSVMYDGREVSLHRVKEIEREKELRSKRTTFVNSFPDDEMFYIQRGYVGNAVSWWGLNNRGYVCDLDRAQAYTKAEVSAHFIDAKAEDTIWAASHVLTKISKMVDSQYLDRKFCA